MKSHAIPLSLLVILIGSVALISAPPEPKPKPKFTLGKDTTYITEPLDKDGYIDYETALNERLRGTITPETNAVVLLMQAIGPKPEGKELHADWWKWLGVKPPRAEGEYFVSLDEFRRKTEGHKSRDDSEWEQLFRQETFARSRPWSLAEIPMHGAWIESNAKALDICVGASLRPNFFSPLVHRPKDGSRPSLTGSVAPWSNRMRSICDAICNRAMNRIARKEFDEAWSDLLAAQRLSRRISGGTTIDYLIGVATEIYELQASATFIAMVPGDARSMEKYRNEWLRLPTPHPLDRTIDLQERFSRLDILQTFHVTASRIQNITLREGFDSRWFESLQRETNDALDKTVASLRKNPLTGLQPIAARGPNNTKVDLDGLGEAFAFASMMTDPEELSKIEPEKVRDVLRRFHSPKIYVKLLHSGVRLHQQRLNLRLAFALAEYRLANGTYPQQLADLAPKYIAAIPADLFNGKPLVYKPAKDGYLLYSVGANGKDDGGKTYGDEPYGCDDLVVRMPLPKLKKE
ncbi:MAG: hypothetical protein KF873_17835 [Gemmataceae bacterium]|nr:hypothetical protein [Gemmataceae bacterium]